MMSAAVSTLMVSGALAQADPPAASPAAPAAKADAAPVDKRKIHSGAGHGQWSPSSKFKGTDVIGPDNAQVGDVNDVLFDKSGEVVGLIVGVGGFLGLGEGVAIDMSAFEPVPTDTGSNTAGGNSAVSSSNDPTSVKLKVSWTRISSRALRTSSTTRQPRARPSTRPHRRRPAWRHGRRPPARSASALGAQQR